MECAACRHGNHHDCRLPRCACEFPLHVGRGSPTPPARAPRVQHADRPPGSRRTADRETPPKKLQPQSTNGTRVRRPGSGPRFQTPGGYRAHQDPARKPVPGRIRIEWATARAARQALEAAETETTRFLAINDWSPAARRLVTDVCGAEAAALARQRGA